MSEVKLGYLVEDWVILGFTLILWVGAFYQYARHLRISRANRAKGGTTSGTPHNFELRAIRTLTAYLLILSAVSLDPHGDRGIWDFRIPIVLQHIAVGLATLFFCGYLTWHTRVSHELTPTFTRQSWWPPIVFGLIALISVGSIAYGAFLVYDESRQYNYVWFLGGLSFGNFAGIMVAMFNKKYIVERGFKSVDAALPAQPVPARTGGGGRLSLTRTEPRNVWKYRAKKKIYRGFKKLLVGMVLYLLMNAIFFWNLLRVENRSISYDSYLSLLRLSDIQLLVNVIIVALTVVYCAWINGNDERLFSTPAARDRAPSFKGMVMARQAADKNASYTCCFGMVRLPCGGGTSSQNKPVKGLPVMKRPSLPPIADSGPSGNMGISASV